MSGQIHFRLPDVGEGIAQAEIIEWLVQVGDEVTEDQPIAVIETDKSQLELPSPANGLIAKIQAAEGDLVEVGAALITIAVAEDERDTATTADQPPSSNVFRAGPTAAHVPPVPSEPSKHSHGATRPARRPIASPSTRRLAVQMGVDLTHIRGSGPQGRILASDLEAAPARGSGFGPESSGTLDESLAMAPVASTREVGTATPGSTRAAPRNGRDETTIITLKGLRRQIAQSMTEALTIPHVFEFREVDAGTLVAARALFRPRFEEVGLRLSILPFLVKAVTWALARHPSLNATFDEQKGEITQYRSVHLGVATATDDGLIVPVLRNSEGMSLRELAAEIERLSDRARTRTATPAELTNGTFTVTNFGSFGAWLGTPVIRPPEVAIAGFGRIQDKVLAIDGHPEVRPVLPLVVATDHRINDGAHLGAFVSEIAAALEQPLLLLDGD